MGQSGDRGGGHERKEKVGGRGKTQEVTGIETGPKGHGKGSVGKSTPKFQGPRGIGVPGPAQ